MKTKVRTYNECGIPAFAGMTRSLLALVLFMLILTLGSCQKYLDIKTANDQRFIETAEDCQKVLDNPLMNKAYPSDGQASADDYYLDNTRFNGLSDLEDRGIYTWDNSVARSLAKVQWTPSYFIIYCANTVSENLDKLKSGDTPKATLDGLRGAALFFRAYSHWQIAQLYAKPYTAATAGTDPGIPLKLESDINEKISRGTVQQTYDRITQDLQEAVGLLPVTSILATRPNKAAAYAMLARVYLSMGDYGQAQTNASAALALKTTPSNDGLLDYNDISTTSTTPFITFNTEVIFQSVTNATNLANPGSETSPVARIEDTFYQSYASNDLRKVIFFKQNKSLVNVPDPTKSSGFTSVTVPDGTYRFTGNYNQSTGTDQFNGLAVDELYLIRAECYARSGNTGLALADLNTLLLKRWAKDGSGQTTYVNLTNTDPNYDTADEVLAKVLTERRKELVFRSQRWTDARRLKLSLTRQTRQIVGTATGVYSATNNPVTYTIAFTYPATATYTLPANDPRFTLLIPLEVITNAGYQQNNRN